MSELYEKMAKELIAGNEAEVKKLTQEAVDGGATARDVLDNGLLAGMDVVGKRFKAGDMFIPEVLLCARTMHGAMDILKPLADNIHSCKQAVVKNVSCGGAPVDRFLGQLLDLGFIARDQLFGHFFIKLTHLIFSFTIVRYALWYLWLSPMF